MTDPFERAARIVAHDGPQPWDAVVPPVVQTSLFTFDSHEAMRATFHGEALRPVYSRTANPTVQAFEAKVAALEGAEAAVAFASGMGAISAAVLGHVRTGDRVVAVRSLYPDAYRLFETTLARFGVAVSYVDGTDLAEVGRALAGARLFYIESPTSWTIEALDVRALAAQARAAGVLSVIDNSWATPLFQQPLALGVDLVLHSASKYLGGHSDVVAGVIAGRAELIAPLRGEMLAYLGARLSPFDAWLLLRGLRTLPVRMRAQGASALEIARLLAAHPAVARVRHPGLGNSLPPGLLGTASLFTVEFREGVSLARLCDSLRVFRLGVSWGGHESLAVPGDILVSQPQEPNPARAFGISPRSLRLHVGLEGTATLWADLAAAIDAACG